MAQGIFTKRQQIRGLIENTWKTTPQAPSTNSFTGYAGVFNGTNQFLNLSSPSQFNFGTNDLTVECYVNLNDVSYATSFFDTRTDSGVLAGTFNFCCLTYNPNLVYQNNTYMSLWLSLDDYYHIRGQDPITPNVWHHVACCRYQNTWTLYLDGVPQGSYYSANSVSTQSTNRPIIGRNGYSGVWYYPGYLSNLRVLNGTALYTGPFTPPSGPLTAITNTVLLTLNGSSIVDGSSYAASITNNNAVTTTATTISITATPPISLTSAPIVDYLVVAGGGSGGVYWGGGGGAGGLLQGTIPVTAGTATTVTVGAGGAVSSVSFQNGNNGGNSVFGSITASGGAGGKSYASCTYPSGGSGGGGSLYVTYGGQGTVGQGNPGGAGTGSGLGQAGGGGGGVGSAGGPGNPGNYGGNGGNGTASAISGVLTTYAGGGGGGGNSGQGLGGYGGGGAGVASGTANNGTVNTGGGGGGQNTQPSSNTPTSGAGGSGIVVISYSDIYKPATVAGANILSLYSGAGSLYFNGSNQYLAMNQTANLGLGNFTIEGWFNASSVTSSSIILDAYNTGSTNSWQLYLTTSAHLAWYNAAVPGTTITGTTTLKAGAWYHFAVVRSGTTITTYINGVQDGTVTDSTNYNNSAVLWVGAQRNAGPNSYFPGNLSNIRIVLGTAVYTAPFTPTTSPLTPISGTQILLNTVSGAPFADSSGNNYVPTVASAAPQWNDSSPLPTGVGYKNRVYQFWGSGTIKF